MKIANAKVAVSTLKIILKWAGINPRVFRRVCGGEILRMFHHDCQKSFLCLNYLAFFMRDCLNEMSWKIPNSSAEGAYFYAPL